MLLHTVLMCSNPGYIVNKDVNFIKMLEMFESDSLCAECQIIRPPGSRHCVICHKCVYRYDHHCPWINNCVGVRNHSLFLVYLAL